METLGNKGENFQKKKDGVPSSASDSTHEAKGCSPPPLGWPIRKATLSKCRKSDEKENEPVSHLEDSKFTTVSSKMSGIDAMKERFAKLLLGEDMSGSGKGVCSALAISNAITNLCEPIPCEKKEMWRREMECLLSVSDHIVELIPSWQTFPDGSKLEVMTCRPRSDLFMNLPALRKLDNMLLEILDSWKDMEFWYVDQGIVAQDADGSASFYKRIQRQEDKWWLPVPRIPPSGLSENSRKQLNHTRECASQILKASMAINNGALAEMEVPESYLETLPKNGRSCLGDFIYHYITSEKFSPECLLDCLDLSSEHVALEIANRVEASIYVWRRRRAHSKPPPNPNRSTTKSSWEIVKDFMADGDKRELLAERAENVLLSLKQRFPGLTQTTLDTSKIQCNKVPCFLSVSGTPHKAIGGTPRKSFSPAPPLISPARGERSPFLRNNHNNIKPQCRGFGVRRVLSNYLGAESKETKIVSNSTVMNGSNPSSNKAEQPERQKKSHAMNGKTN
ncbi:hypothetical protein JHK86_039137 [Glycine max]|nr:hypothetical protein JHK86_039137 [Glycine max]